MNKRELIVLGSLILLIPFFYSNATAQTVMEVLNRNNETTIFANTIQKAGLEARLNSGGPYTLFVPSNKSLQEEQDRLNRSSSSSLEDFILNHVLTGMATKRQIRAMSKAPSLGGLVLEMETDENDDVIINEIPVIRYNVRAQNGVIHIIDGTLE